MKIDDVMDVINNWTENVTYGEMEEIAKDKNKIDLMLKYFKEFASRLNDINIMSKKDAKTKGEDDGQ